MNQKDARSAKANALSKSPWTKRSKIMTTINIISNRHIKRSYKWDHYSTPIQQLIDQVTCVQKSVVNLRKNLSHITGTSPKQDRSF